MSQDDLADRLDAVERRLDAAYPPATGGDDASEHTDERIEAFAERLADLEAAVEAVEGYVGEIERVDAELEDRADAALTTADGLESRVETLEARVGNDAAAQRERRDAMDAGIGTGRDAGAGDTGSQHQHDRPDDAPAICACEQGSAYSEATDAAASRPQHPARSAQGDAHAGAAGQHSAPDGGCAVSDGLGTSLDRAGRGNDVPGTKRPTADDPGQDRSPRRSQTAETSPSDPGNDGGATARDPKPRGSAARSRTEPASRPSVSGWGGADSSVDDRGADGSRGGSSAPVDDDDRRWAEPSTETLLDRLRSLL